MSHGPELDRLARGFAEHPASSCFAALAEGLRKRGSLDDAVSVATQGVGSRPEYLPGHLVLARIYRDRKQWEAARRELLIAQGLDPTHPVVVDALAHLDQLDGGAGTVEPRPAELDADPAEAESGGLLYSDGIDRDSDAAPEASPSGDSVLTESLAMLYWAQGHLERAVEAFDALVTLHPGKQELSGRRDAVRAELIAQRPPAYHAAESGGSSVRAWLASIAAAKAPLAPPASSFDAFYRTPAPQPTERGDLAAFQAWLRELGR